MIKKSVAVASWFILLLFPLVTLGLSVGEPAPEIKAKNQDGKIVRLEDFRGKPVVIYFYPKDDTPGCTKEACHFRDDYSKFEKRGVVVLGVSRQDEKSHQEFKKKYHLPFDLLVDTDGRIGRAFGIGSMPLVGLSKRQSVLIDKNGRVAKIYDEVRPDEHSDEVLKDLAKLSS